MIDGYSLISPMTKPSSGGRESGKFIGPAFNIGPDTMYATLGKSVESYVENSEYVLERYNKGTNVRKKLAEKPWTPIANFNPETNAPFEDIAETTAYLKKHNLDSTHYASGYAAGGIDRGSVFVKNEEAKAYTQANVDLVKKGRNEVLLSGVLTLEGTSQSPDNTKNSRPAPATSSSGGGGKPPASAPPIATPPEEPSGQNSNTGKPAATSPKAKEPSSKPNTPANQWGKITKQAAGASFEETEEFLKNFPDHEPAKTHLAILKEQDEVDRVAAERNEKKAKARGFSSGATLTKAEINARKLESERETKAQQIEEEKQRKLERKWAAIERREANNSQKNTPTGKAATPAPTNPAPTSGGGSGGKPPVTPPQSSPLPEEQPNPKGTPPKRVSTEMAEMQENVEQQAKKDAEEQQAKKAATAANKTSYPEEERGDGFKRNFQGMEPKPGETAGLNRPIPTRFANQRGNLTLPPALKGIGNLDIDQFANSRTLFQNDVAVNTRGPKYSNVMHQKIDKEKFNATKEEFAEKKAQLTRELENQQKAKTSLVAETVENQKIKANTPLIYAGKNPNFGIGDAENNKRLNAITNEHNTLNSSIKSTRGLISANADELDLELYRQNFDPEGIDNAKSGIGSPLANEARTSRHGAISAAAKGLSAFGSTFVPGSGYATRETLEHGFGMGFKNAVAASRGEHLARFVSNANPLGASGRAAFTESLGIANRSDVQRFLQNRTFMNGVGAFGAPIGAAAIVGMGMHDMQDPGEILGNLATGGAVIGGFRAGKSAGAMLTPANSKIGRGLGMAVGGTVGAVTGGLVAAGLYGILNDASQNDSAIRKFAKKVGTKEMYSMSQDTRESLTARQQALNKLAKSGLNDRAQLLRK